MIKEQDEPTPGLLFHLKTGRVIASGDEAIDKYLTLDNPDKYIYIETEWFSGPEYRKLLKSAEFRIGYGIAIRHLRKAGLL